MTNIDEIMKKSYVDSLYYNVRLTSRYLKFLGIQLLEKLNIDLAFDEFVALDILHKDGELCQRDLAKLILKDRAGTGRIASELEKRGLIDINIEKRCNRLIKKMTITEAGKKILDESISKLKPVLDGINADCDMEEESKLINSLKELRIKIGKILETQI